MLQAWDAGVLYKSWSICKALHLLLKDEVKLARVACSWGIQSGGRDQRKADRYSPTQALPSVRCLAYHLVYRGQVRLGWLLGHGNCLWHGLDRWRAQDARTWMRSSDQDGHAARQQEQRSLLHQWGLRYLPNQAGAVLRRDNAGLAKRLWVSAIQKVKAKKVEKQFEWLVFQFRWQLWGYRRRIGEIRGREKGTSQSPSWHPIWQEWADWATQRLRGIVEDFLTVLHRCGSQQSELLDAKELVRSDCGHWPGYSHWDHNQAHLVLP